MLYWILIFLIAVIIFGGLSFSGIIGAVILVGLLKILFFVFLVLFIVAMLKYLMSGCATS